MVQNNALERMKDTYQSPAAVLVLDFSLLRYRAMELTDVEILMRIVCCRCISRLW
jgi:hypothetical protein